MASLKCSNCGFGIHYHDEPNGIEITAISYKTWNTFSNTNSPIIHCITDGPEDYLSIWRCPKCGTLHVFKASSAFINNVYVLSKDPVDIKPDISSAYIIFVDTVFENITENDVTAQELETTDKYGDYYYAVFTDKYALIYKDKDLTQLYHSYVSIM